MLRQISEHIILGFGRLSFQIFISVSVPNSSLIVCYGGCPCSSFLFPGGQVSGIFSTISHLLAWPLTLLGLHHLAFISCLLAVSTFGTSSICADAIYWHLYSYIHPYILLLQRTMQLSTAFFLFDDPTY